MKLYLVHCGFYDSEICDGLYEGHVNYFVVAESFEEAKVRAKELTEFKNKKMHIDGLQEIQRVNGYMIDLVYDATKEGETQIVNYKHRELAPKGK
jgi:hypothetical protein